MRPRTSVPRRGPEPADIQAVRVALSQHLLDTLCTLAGASRCKKHIWTAVICKDIDVYQFLLVYIFEALRSGTETNYPIGMTIPGHV